MPGSAGVYIYIKNKMHARMIGLSIIIIGTFICHLIELILMKACHSWAAIKMASLYLSVST